MSLPGKKMDAKKTNNTGDVHWSTEQELSRVYSNAARQQFIQKDLGSSSGQVDLAWHGYNEKSC